MAGVLSSFLRKNAISTQKRLMSHGTPEQLEKSFKLWRNLFYFVGIPALVLIHANCYVLTKEEDHSPPEFVAYDYLRIRTKRFPWGDGNHTLFHNPHMNALPDGYEEVHDKH